MLQVTIVLSSKIGYLKTVLSIIYLVYCLIIPIFNIKYLLILYHIFFQLVWLGLYPNL